MADAKISALPAVVTPAGTDQFAVNQGGTTKKETLTQVLNFVLNGIAGGKTLTGGTDASEDLTLVSTSNATKGLINLGAAGTSFFDETDSSLTLNGNLTMTSPTASVIDGIRDDVSISAGNGLLFFSGEGDIGSGPVVGADIRLRADGTWTGISNAGEIQFRTTEEGSTSPTIRMVIRNDGNVGIGTTAPGIVAPAFTTLTVSDGVSDGSLALIEMQGGRIGSNGGIGNLEFLNGTVRLAAIVGRRQDADNSGALQIFTSDAGVLTEKVKINPDGLFIINDELSIGTILSSAQLTILAGASGLNVDLIKSTDDSASANFQFKKSRGSSGSETDVLIGDSLNNLRFQGWKDGAFRTGAQIRSTVEDTGTNIVAAGINFFTTNSSGVNEIKMNLDKDGAFITLFARTKKRIVLATGGATTGNASLYAVTDTAAPRTVTLASIEAVDGRHIDIKDESGGAAANNITIDTQGAELIDGAASIVISANFGISRIYSDGTNFFTR